MMFGPANLPNPVKPGGEDMAVINKAIRQMLENNPETAELMKKYPAWQPFEPANPFAAFMRPSQQAPGQDPPSNQQLLAAGWGYAMIDPSSIQADNGAGLTRGIIGLTNHGQPRKPDDWGSLRAWAWGPGVPPAVWIISKPILTSMQSTSALKVYPDTARPRW